MATRSRNEFLDAGDSEDDQSQGYDSAADELTKGGRSSKRRRVESDVDENEGEQEEEDGSAEDEAGQQLEEIDETAAPTDAKKPHRSKRDSELAGISKPLTKKNLIASEAAIKRSGVVYLSRIPPFMKPSKLRSLLEPHGAINRIFLTPEDASSHTRRVRGGGNKKRSFVDGWVEFVSKAEAKRACELLNAQIIGGKKGTYYHDDVWNLLYLKGFKWRNLTEQITAENAERASRMRAEIGKTTKENKEFVINVERAKMLEGMEAKKAAKRRRGLEDGLGEGVEAPVKEFKAGAERPRHFKQTPVATKRTTGEQPEQVKRVLSKIF